jgi:drug/metabolite transporter (DMT)-like permease
MNPTTLRLLLTFASGSLIGLGFIVAKLLLNAGAGQATLAFVQMVGAAAVLAAWSGVKGTSLPFSGVTLKYFAFSAGISVLAVPLLGNWVMARIPTGVFTLLVTLSPLITTLLGAALDRRLPSPRILAGSALGLAGALLVLVPRAHALEPGQSLAMTVALGVPVLLAIGNVYRTRRWPKDLSASAATTGTLLVQPFLLAPMSFSGEPDFAALIAHWPLMLLLIATTVAGNLTGSTLQKLAGAGAYSQIGYVIALSGIVASCLLFGEQLDVMFWPALALVFAGIALTNRIAAPAAAPAIVQRISPQH